MASLPPMLFPPGAMLLIGLALPMPLELPVLAQGESYILKPGSKVGPATKVKPTNCVTAADGTVTCDTELENPEGDTPAKPQIQLFRN